MSYDNPVVGGGESARYYMPSSAYGATAAQIKIMGPKGKKGIVRDIEYIPTADNVGTTTVPEIAVGATAGAAEYARWKLGTTATAGYTSAQGTRRARALCTKNPTPPVLVDFTAHVQLETAVIPADTNVFISGVAGVGGGIAGTWSAYVNIDWF